MEARKRSVNLTAFVSAREKILHYVGWADNVIATGNGVSSDASRVAVFNIDIVGHSL
jgi:hypothetical protein